MECIGMKRNGKGKKLRKKKKVRKNDICIFVESHIEW